MTLSVFGSNGWWTVVATDLAGIRQILRRREPGAQYALEMRPALVIRLGVDDQGRVYRHQWCR